jgi:hypothetical protein
MSQTDNLSIVQRVKKTNSNGGVWGRLRPAWQLITVSNT